jgi:hypothetical protein
MEINNDNVPNERVQLVIHFKDNISAMTVSAILDSVENSFQTAMKTVVETGILYPFSQVEIENARKIIQLKQKSFRIQEFDSGSLLIVGSVTLSAVFLYILKITVGESMKQAWLESDMHVKTKRILSTKLPGTRVKEATRVAFTIALSEAALNIREIDGVTRVKERNFDNHHSKYEDDSLEFAIEVNVDDHDMFDLLTKNVNE